MQQRPDSAPSWTGHLHCIWTHVNPRCAASPQGIRTARKIPPIVVLGLLKYLSCSNAQTGKSSLNRNAPKYAMPRLGLKIEGYPIETVTGAAPKILRRTLIN